MDNEKLPKGWGQCYVGQCSTLIRGVTYTKEHAVKSSGKGLLPVLRANNIDGDINFENLVYVPSDIVKLNQVLKEGDILFSLSSGSKNLVGKSSLVRHDLEFSFGAFCGVIRPVKWIFHTFLFLLFQTRKFRNTISESSSGSNINNLKREHLLRYAIPLPPLNEQRRIVEKVEELFSELETGVESLRTARTQLGVYRQSLLKQAFEGKLTERWRAEHADELESPDELLARIRQERETRYKQQLSDWKAAVAQWEHNGKPGKKPSKPRKPKPLSESNNSFSNPLPDRWVSINLGETTVEIFDGPFGSNLKTSDYVDSGVRVIRLENIGCGAFIEEKYSYISHKKYLCLQRHTVFPGDIVFSSFLNDSVRASIVPDSVEYAVNKADCFCVRCYGSILSKDYLLQAFLARYFYKALESQVHGVGRPRINTTQLGSASIPLCSLAEQREIVRILEEQFSVIEENEKEIDAALERAEALRQSILKKAFAGELVPQDPNDEPASVLLERIRAEREAQADKPTSRRAPRKKSSVS